MLALISGKSSKLLGAKLAAKLQHFWHEEQFEETVPSQYPHRESRKNVEQTLNKADLFCLRLDNGGEKRAIFEHIIQGTQQYDNAARH